LSTALNLKKNKAKPVAFCVGHLFISVGPSFDGIMILSLVSYIKKPQVLNKTSPGIEKVTGKLKLIISLLV